MAAVNIIHNMLIFGHLRVNSVLSHTIPSIKCYYKSWFTPLFYSRTIAKFHTYTHLYDIGDEPSFGIHIGC